MTARLRVGTGVTVVCTDHDGRCKYAGLSGQVVRRRSSAPDKYLSVRFPNGDSAEFLPSQLVVTA